MKKYNYGIAIVLILISIWVLFECRDLGVAAEGTAMGPGVWPSILAVAMIILSIALIIQTLIQSYKDKKNPDGEDTKPLIDFKSEGMKRIYILIGIFIIFAILIKLFGFYISLIFLIPAVLVLFGERDVKTIVLFTAGILLFVFLVFVLMLDLRLPKGSLIPW